MEDRGRTAGGRSTGEPRRRGFGSVPAEGRHAGRGPGAKLIEDLQEDERGLDLFARLALRDAPGEARLLVVVDQFEEVFTYRPQDEQAKARFEKARAAFFANLLLAAAASGGRVAVVLTMRSDFLGACASFTRLNDVLNAHLVQVGPMQEDELREAINRPAYLVGCEVEPALSERLLADVEGQPGALPLGPNAKKRRFAVLIASPNFSRCYVHGSRNKTSGFKYDW